MKFNCLKEYINYLDLMGDHLLKISKNKKSTFVYDDKVYQNLYRQFEKETARNFTNNESHQYINQSYRPVLISWVRKWDQLLDQTNIQPEDFMKYPDELHIPFIHKTLKENRNFLFALGSRFHFSSFYPVIQKPFELIVRKERIQYQRPSQSADPIIHFKKEFIEIELAEIPEKIEKLRHLETTLDKYIGFRTKAKIESSESRYYNKVNRELDRWLRQEQERVIAEIRNEDSTKKTPYLSIDGRFHYNAELSFLVHDYFGEKCYTESTFTHIRNYFEKQFPEMSETERITESSKLAIAASLSVGEEFHRACSESLSRLATSMSEQLKVNQIEKELIYQIELIMQDETIEYVEAYKKISDISFQIEKRQNELLLSIRNPDINTDLTTVEELCRSQIFRYAELRKSKRFSNQKTSIPVTAKLKTKLTVDELAYLFRILHDEGLIICSSKTQLAKTISENFETIGKQNLSPDSIRNKMATPNHKVADVMHTRFIQMMQRAGKDKENL